MKNNEIKYTNKNTKYIYLWIKNYEIIIYFKESMFGSNVVWTNRF